MCDVQKHPYRIDSAIALPSEKTVKKVTITVMVNDCTTISLFECSYINVHLTTDKCH